LIGVAVVTASCADTATVGEDAGVDAPAAVEAGVFTLLLPQAASASIAANGMGKRVLRNM
jgi:hypothetical protein